MRMFNISIILHTTKKNMMKNIKVGQPKLLGQMKNQLLGEKKKDFLVANG